MTVKVFLDTFSGKVYWIVFCNALFFRRTATTQTMRKIKMQLSNALRQTQQFRSWAHSMVLPFLMEDRRVLSRISSVLQPSSHRHRMGSSINAGADCLGPPALSKHLTEDREPKPSAGQPRQRPCRRPTLLLCLRVEKFVSFQQDWICGFLTRNHQCGVHQSISSLPTLRFGFSYI